MKVFERWFGDGARYVLEVLFWGVVGLGVTGLVKFLFPVIGWGFLGVAVGIFLLIGFIAGNVVMAYAYHKRAQANAFTVYDIYVRDIETAIHKLIHGRPIEEQRKWLTDMLDNRKRAREKNKP